jgi:FMN phosphatase YigB (HAD superfamily)
MRATEAERPQGVIFDVDGTLCDVRSVRHFVEVPSGIKRSRANFDKFHQGSAGCPAFDNVRRLAQAVKLLDFRVLIVTGRESKWNSLTAEWLDKQAIPYDALKTRKARDYRPDEIVKREILAELLKSYSPLLAVDDRVDIIQVWNAANVPTLQVALDGSYLRTTLPASVDWDPRVLTLLAAEGAL